MIKQTKRLNIFLFTFMAFISVFIFSLLPQKIYLGIKNVYKDNFVNLEKNEFKKKIYDGEKLFASSYVIYDHSKNKTVLEYNNAPRPLASITKLITAYVALDNCQDNIILNGNTVNKTIAIEKMLIESSNAAADAIANICPNRKDFINNMNKLSKEMLLGFTFKNPSGLDEEDETLSSAFGTPEDVAVFLNEFYKKYPNILEVTSHSVFEGFKNTNQYASTWPFLLGSKTGYTDTANGNLAILIEPVPNQKLSIVVLGSTREERFNDVYKLMTWYLRNR